MGGNTQLKNNTTIHASSLSKQRLAKALLKKIGEIEPRMGHLLQMSREKMFNPDIMEKTNSLITQIVAWRGMNCSGNEFLKIMLPDFDLEKTKFFYYFSRLLYENSAETLAKRYDIEPERLEYLYSCAYNSISATPEEIIRRYLETAINFYTNIAAMQKQEGDNLIHYVGLYTQTKDPLLYSIITQELQKTVIKIARQRKNTLPSDIDIQDIIQEGNMGMLDAVNKYDPSKEFGFLIYLKLRINGAITDFLREKDIMPRTDRKDINYMELAKLEFTKQNARPPSEKELATIMGIKMDELFRIISLSARREFSIDSKNSKGRGYIDYIVNPDSISPLEVVLAREIERYINDAIGTLDERSQRIWKMHREQNITQKEIGIQLKISESRVSQLLTECIGVIRKKLSALGVDSKLA
ncbi:MAG: sigma-70 family RNA polymerase sigma factor [Candidatus Micrarchaeia archaeon]|jgi:RNA polymerase sigma factor for flagellar operon FliA